MPQVIRDYVGHFLINWTTISFLCEWGQQNGSRYGIISPVESSKPTLCDFVQPCIESCKNLLGEFHLGWCAVHLLLRSAGCRREGKFKHAEILLYDPVETSKSNLHPQRHANFCSVGKFVTRRGAINPLRALTSDFMLTCFIRRGCVNASFQTC